VLSACVIERIEPLRPRCVNAISKLPAAPIGQAESDRHQPRYTAGNFAGPLKRCVQWTDIAHSNAMHGLGKQTRCSVVRKATRSAVRKSLREGTPPPPIGDRLNIVGEGEGQFRRRVNRPQHERPANWRCWRGNHHGPISAPRGRTSPEPAVLLLARCCPLLVMLGPDPNIAQSTHHRRPAQKANQR
jgi:hypothetical protein